MLRREILKDNESVAHDLNGLRLQKQAVTGVNLIKHGISPYRRIVGVAECGEDEFGIGIGVVGGGPVVWVWERLRCEGKAVDGGFEVGGRGVSVGMCSVVKKLLCKLLSE